MYVGRVWGERIVLREFRQEDIAGMRQWVTDDEITRQLGGAFSRPKTWEETEQYLASLLRGDVGGTHFAIAERDSLKYIGQCDLTGLDDRARKAALSIVLCRERIGRGLGREAVALLLNYAFRQMNLHRVSLHVMADNERAIRCYEACGFQREGTLRAERYADGQYWDVLVMGILREEYDRA